MNDVAADGGRRFDASPAGDSAGSRGHGRCGRHRCSQLLAGCRRTASLSLSPISTATGPRIWPEISGKADGVGQARDVSAAESVAALFGWLTHDFGRCDVLVNNAGVASTASLAEVQLERGNSTIAINVTGALLTTQHAVSL